MKKIIYISMFLFSVMASFAQILIDNGGLYDEDSRYVLQGSKWNKNPLTYYINNVSNSMTAPQRESTIQTALQRWAAVTDLTFTQVYSSALADLKFRWVPEGIDHGCGAGVNDIFTSSLLAHAWYPGTSQAGQICFNDNLPWVMEGQGMYGYVLVSAAMHEIGHALGLAHSSDAGSIMRNNFTGQTTLGADDILGINALYGINISGSALICSSSSQNFSATNLPTGFSWGNSNNLNLPNTTSNPTSVSANGSGAGWVSIKNSALTELKRFNVWVGAINLTSSSISGPSDVQVGVNTAYSVNLPQGADVSVTGYQWSVNPNVSSKIISANSSTAGITFGSPGYYEVFCKVSNACGWGSDNYTPVWVYNRRSYSVPYPNPVSGVLTVGINPDMVAETRSSMQASGLSQQSFLLNIKLFDTSGVLHRQTASTGENITIDVSRLRNGMYILQVHDGISVAPETHTIIVNN